jgi:hypothetical protein
MYICMQKEKCRKDHVTVLIPSNVEFKTKVVMGHTGDFYSTRSTLHYYKRAKNLHVTTITKLNAQTEI